MCLGKCGLWCKNLEKLPHFCCQDCSNKVDGCVQLRRMSFPKKVDKRLEKKFVTTGEKNITGNPLI